MILTAMKMTIFFWVMRPCRLVGGYLQKHSVSIFRAEVAVLGSGKFIQGQKKGRLGEMAPSRKLAIYHWSALPLTVYKLSISQHCDFSHEGADIMLIQNVGIYLRVYKGS
jgi:hypothetical protein